MSNTVAYSRDDEDFRHTDLGAFMDNLDSDGELVPGRVYYEVDVAPMTHEHVISESEVFGLLERLDEAVYEDVGEVADNDYYGVSAEARAELRKLLIRWADEHVRLGYWRITSTKAREKTFTAAEIAEYHA